MKEIDGIWKRWASGEKLPRKICKYEVRYNRIVAVELIANCIRYAIWNPESQKYEINNFVVESIREIVGVPDIDRKLDLIYISNKFPNLRKYYGALLYVSAYRDEILSMDSFIKWYLVCLICEKDGGGMILRKTFREAEEYLLELFREYSKE
jgi:hypothetical protein